MNRKTILDLTMAAAVLLASACSSSDNESLFEVETSVLSQGIQTDLHGGYYDVDLKSSQPWSASVSADCDWVDVLNGQGLGTASVHVYVNENSTGVSRNTTLLIKSGEQQISVAIQQLPTKDGEPADNSADFMDIAYNKGIGKGFDVTTLKSKSNVIFERKPIMELMAFDDYSDLITEDLKQTLEMEMPKVDSIELKQDTLGVHASLEIAYSTFKFGLSADFKMGEDRVSNGYKRTMVANYPALETSIDYISLLYLYLDYLDGEEPEFDADKDYRQSIFSRGFKGKYESLVKKCEGKSDYKEVESDLRSFVNNYGHAFCVSSKMGGMYYLEFAYDSVYCKEYLGVDDATVTASIKSGLFSLNAEAKATYEKQAESILEHSNLSCWIIGGETAKQIAITNQLKNPPYSGLSETLAEWVNSIVVDNDSKTNNADILSRELVPVWELFDGTDAYDLLRDYILATVPEDNDILRPYR